MSRLQIPFICISPDVDESALQNELPQETALRLAQAKARRIGEMYNNALIIGCDQVATLDNLQIGKPLSHAKATQQLRLMRGHEVIFHSALCLFNTNTLTMQSIVEPYVVKFKNLTDVQIESYLLKEQPYNCAGSAKSEGLGIAIIEKMVGDDPNALIGLPLIKLVGMLENEGVHVI